MTTCFLGVSCGDSNIVVRDDFIPWRLLKKEDACRFGQLSLERQSDESYVFDAHNDDYALGALIAAASLRKYSKKDIVVMLSGSATDRLVPYFNRINVRHVFVTTSSIPNSKLDRYAYSMIKLCAYNLTSYKRIIFVDSDTFFMIN